jgi:hypothetical protein
VRAFKITDHGVTITPLGKGSPARKRK